MGCFLACFGSADGRRRKSKNKSLTRDRSRRNYEHLEPTSPVGQGTVEKQAICTPEASEKAETLSLVRRKKVTFDLNVNTYIEVETTEVPISPELGEEKTDDQKAEKQTETCLPKDGSIRSSPVTFPSNHRYENCVISDEEDADADADDEDEHELEYEGSDFEEDDDIEESYESCFSIPLESQQKDSADSEDKKEISSPIQTSNSNGVRDRSQYVHSVLNPVENLTQWKALKAKPVPLNQKEEKIVPEEGIRTSFGLEPTFKYPRTKETSQSGLNGTGLKENVSSLSMKQEVAVDASLSNWLELTQTKPIAEIGLQGTQSQTSSSPNKYDDRPILGALTVEDIRRSASSSPRSPRSRSPDEIPILGTVGSYWSHQNIDLDPIGTSTATSKYREDKKVSWDSTPFDVRLHTALSHGAA